jgi:hypothetical protein
MHIHSRLAAVLGCAAALAMVGCAANGSLTPSNGAPSEQASSSILWDAGWIQKDGVVYHVPHYMPTREKAPRPKKIKPDTTFTYYGGPVLVTPTVYLIIWDYAKYSDPDNIESLLESYLPNMGGSGHNNIYIQYYEKTGSTTTYITNPANQYGGVWVYKKKAPTSPTDEQVAEVALAGVAHFGYNANGSYIVATPHHHSTPGFGSQWCGYHSETRYQSHNVSYTNLPYMPDAGPSCGANYITPPADEPGVDEGVTIVEGHEDGESTTDPVVGLGWYNATYGEIGDICAWQNIQNDPFDNGSSYTMQPMFSNASQSCVHSYTPSK